MLERRPPATARLRPSAVVLSIPAGPPQHDGRGEVLHGAPPRGEELRQQTCPSHTGNEASYIRWGICHANGRGYVAGRPAVPRRETCLGAMGSAQRTMRPNAPLARHFSARVAAAAGRLGCGCAVLRARRKPHRHACGAPHPRASSFPSRRPGAILDRLGRPCRLPHLPWRRGCSTCTGRSCGRR